MAESFDVVECGNTDAVLNAAWSEAVPPQPPLEPATFSFESNERSSWRLPSYSRITPCFCHISRVDIFPRAKAIKLEGERRLVDTRRRIYARCGQIVESQEENPLLEPVPELTAGAILEYNVHSSRCHLVLPNRYSSMDEANPSRLA